jgi:hypothetical protein
MQAKRLAIFFSAATVAGAFGGILAYGIEHLEGYVTMFRSCPHPLIFNIHRKAGLHGWQWIVCNTHSSSLYKPDVNIV